MKRFNFKGGCVLVVVLVFCLPALASLNITEDDVQLDSEGYYYEYKLTYNDMGNSTKFFNDVMSRSNVSVAAPTNIAERYIAADTGDSQAEFIYKFDFSPITMSDGSRMVIRNVQIQDSITLCKNFNSTENTLAASGWSYYNSVYGSYYTIINTSTPTIGSQKFTGSLDKDFSGLKQKFYYKVQFANQAGDFNGFDDGLNRWNHQTKTTTDYFKVVVRLANTAPAGTYAGGNGTEADPYQIATAAQLDAIGDYQVDWDKYFELTADIDMSDYFYYRSVIDGIFSGDFNGNGYTISNLTINGHYGVYCGMFCYTDSESSISNLNMENVKINFQQNSFAGAIAGRNYGSITNCHVSGQVSGWHDIGGIAGISDDTSIIDNCSFSGILYGIEDVGGIAGYNSGTIENSNSSGSIVATEIGAGGITETNQGYINNCWTDASILSSRLGGICGDNGSEGIISNCYVNCYLTLSGDGRMGGVIGKNSGELKYCYAVSNMTMFKNYTADIGGLVGVDDSSAIYTACFWDTDVAGTTDGVGDSDDGATPAPDPDPTGVYPRNTIAMKNLTTFTAYGWDFVGETANGSDDIWNIVGGQTYPRFVDECINRPKGDINGDCVVDMLDFAELVSSWLSCGLITQSVSP